MPPKTNVRQQLIDATKALLWERGFESTSPGSILERADVGQGGLYYHFRGKPDLAAAALVEVAAEMRAGAENRLQRPGHSAFENILDWIVAPREAVRGCRLGRFANEPSVTENDGLAEPIRGYFSSLRRMIADALGQAQQDGDFDPGADVEEIADALVAVVQGGYVLSRLYADAAYMERANRAAAAMLRARATS